MKTIIGAGILSLPFTMSRLGYIFGFLLYATVIGINQFTAILLIKCKNLSRHSNYSTIMKHIFNSNIAQMLTSFTILFKNTGICIIELTILKQALNRIFSHFFPQNIDSFYFQEWFIVLALSAMEIPFIIMDKIEKLRYMAFIGVIGIFIFIICLIVAFFEEMIEGGWIVHMEPFPSDWLKFAAVIPNIMLAMAYHVNFFPIYKGMEDTNDQRMKRASLVALIVVGFLYLLVGNIGYALYGQKAQANFLLNLDPENINKVLYFGMNIGFLTSVFFSFPVMFFGARNNFISIILAFKFRKQKVTQLKQNATNSHIMLDTLVVGSNSLMMRQERVKKIRIYFFLFTFVLFAFTVSIAVAVSDIQSVFNFVGAIASNLIAYLFPSFFYFLLVRKKIKQRTIFYKVAIGLLAFFIPFGIFSIVVKYI